jgi:nucleolar protein 56
MAVELVSTFYGAYSIEHGAIVRKFESPSEPGALLERVRMRRDGRRTPEEQELISATAGRERFTRDRRLAVEGVELVTRPQSRASLPPLERFDATWHDVLLAEAAEALAGAWDPSVHLDEAVRSLADYDEISNLLGERLDSWNARAEGSTAGGTPPEPSLADARGRLTTIRTEVASARAELEDTLKKATPELAPNLSALLGPLLAARLISKAGGLKRLARFPASTIQVLGAERAFFDHLRGKAPPPRHGLMFIHPDIQGAPRNVRGRIARALAGKAAIAARLDLARRPVDPRLVTGFKERSRQARASRPGRPRRR